MTGYTVHTGSNDKFRDGWERIFNSKPAKKKSAEKQAPQAKKKPTPSRKKS